MRSDCSCSRLRNLLLGTLLVAVAMHSASAEEGLGGHFQVNTNEVGLHFVADVAAAADGSFVVVWGNGASSGFFPKTIQAQRFNPNGATSGGQFQVNSDPLLLGTYVYPVPQVAVDDAGGAFVVWWRESGGDEIIAGKRYDASGTAVSGEFSVAGGGATDPTVAVAGDGAAMVAWKSDTSAGTDQSDTSIQARRYDVTGSAIGAPFQVNTTTTGRQQRQRVSIGPEGSAVVVWTETSSPSATRGQRYDSSGNPAGAEFVAFAGGQHVDVAHAPSGEFLVTNGGRRQLYDASGNPVGSQPFVYGGYGDQHSVAASPNGEFVVTWDSNKSDGEYIVHGHRFDAAGDLVGSTFQVSVSTAFIGYPDVSFGGDDRFIIAWHGGHYFDSNIIARRSGFFNLPALGTVGLMMLSAAALVAGVRSLR